MTRSPMSWIERMLTSLLLIVAAVTSKCAGQEICDEHLPVCPAADFAAFADSQWQYVLACSGLTPQPGGDLHDVEWRLVPRDSLAAGHAYALGRWIAPNIIELDSTHQHSVWVVRHELLHHLTRGPPDDEGGPHPWFPFAQPCEVMPGQHFALP